MRILSFFVLISSILLNFVCVWIQEEREREEKKKKPTCTVSLDSLREQHTSSTDNDSLNTASRSLYSHGKERAIVHQLPTALPQQNQSYCSQCL